MSSTSQRLKEQIEKSQQQKRVINHLNHLNGQLAAEYKGLTKWEKKLKKEFKDIEKLEKMTMKGLFHSVLGSKEKQIEKERQEYLQASLKFNEAKKTVELLEYERDILEEQASKFEQLEATIEALMKKREEELIAHNSEAGNKILELILRIDKNSEQIYNMDHVIKSGEKILEVLGRMVSHLSRARNWGQWDMAGDRRAASYYKHSSIDKAKELSYHAKNMLRRYEHDLKNIYGNRNFGFNIHLESFNKFTDIFFDNLISDWIIQQKITNALSNIKSVRDRVTRIHNSLQSDRKTLKHKNEALEEQRKSIIIES